MSDTDQASLAQHAERQTAALETIRKVLIALVWALGTIAFLALVVAYVLAVA
jgi:hypothetical protein